MAFGRSFLENHPGMLRWLLSHESFMDLDAPPATKSLLQFAAAVLRIEHDSPISWLISLRSILSAHEDPTNAFGEMDRLCRTLGSDLQQIIADLSEFGMSRGQAKGLYRHLSFCADLTGMVSLRFLAAWSALNMGDHKRCIEECLHVELPFAQVKTLLGQAQLECGQAQEAIKALTAAVTLDPKEVLAWFQLAKAHSVLENHDEAWQALQQCYSLAPESEEIAVFMGMLAISKPVKPDRTALAWQNLTRYVMVMRKSPDFLRIMIELGLCVGREDKLVGELDAFDWNALSHNRDYLAQLPDILRILKSENWMLASQCILENTCPSLSQTS
jgi:tetratricopeptide (TPR) repeat protein